MIDSTAKTEFFVRTVWNLRSEPVLKNSVFGLFAVDSIIIYADFTDDFPAERSTSRVEIERVAPSVVNRERWGFGEDK